MEERTLELPTHCARTDVPDAVLQWDSREECEVRKQLDRLADKWTLQVLALLDERTYRFNELQRRLDGVSHRMLATTLRQLERDGMLIRTVHPTVTVRGFPRPCASRPSASSANMSSQLIGAPSSARCPESTN